MTPTTSILIVDDNDLCKPLSTSLASSRRVIHEAATAEDGLRVLLAHELVRILATDMNSNKYSPASSPEALHTPDTRS